MPTNVQRSYFDSFTNFFVKNILPIEAYLTLLRGEKDYELYYEVIKVLHNGLINIKITTEINTYLKSNLFPIYMRLAKSYIAEVHSSPLKEQLSSVKEDLNKIINQRELDVLQLEELEQIIQIIENTLEYSFVNKLNNENYQIKHEDGIIDLPAWKQSLSESIQAYHSYIDATSIIVEKLETMRSSHPDLVTDDQFIFIVVATEGWSFLTHFSVAYAINYTESVKIANIQRGIRHLERAILDVYKYLIVDSNIINPEIMKLRTSELLSFGNNTKVSNTYIKYKDFVEENILKS